MRLIISSSAAATAPARTAIRSRPLALLAVPLATLILVVSGCATAPSAPSAPPEKLQPQVDSRAPSGTPVARAAPPAASASGAAAAAPPAAASAPPGLAGLFPGGGPGVPPPFATVIREAKRIEGPLTLWQKDDKVWIELKPSDLGRPFLLSPKIKTGIGEAWVLGGLMAYPVGGAGGVQLVEFVKVHNTLRMMARNTDVVAKPGTPEARAVADAYSPSLLGAAPVASAPHPERKSILVEANPLFLNDMLGVGMMLQRAFRQGYSLERSNTLITGVRTSPDAVIIETQNHYYSPNISTLPFGMMPGGPMPSTPRYLPDTRSMLVGLHFSLAPLPEQPMASRLADPRVGLFTTTLLNFSDDLPLTPRQRVVNRWRLEKKDATAALSEPVKPITFWIDRNVPMAYRETVREAVLEWNKAFEKIGFKDAIVAKQQPEDAKWDTLDYGYASVRWMLNAEPAFGAIGPSHVDPRSGEILDADIAFEGMSARSVRGLRTQVLPTLSATLAATLGGGVPTVAALPGTGDAAGASLAEAANAPPHFATPFGGGKHDHRLCQYGAMAAEQMSYAVDVLEARGELDPDSPAAQRFVMDYIKDSIMHEVGHALGLRHNFRASRVYTEAQLSDLEFTRANGTTGSVMEYNAVNLPRPGQTGGTPFMTTLGPYDFWAVEYAYKQAPKDATLEEERKMLQAVAARSNEPLLAFGTDEDAFFGIDPETIQMDLGNDPIVFAAKRIDIARDLFRRQEIRELPEDRDYAVLRRSLGYALNDATRAVGVLVRQIGGLRTLRDFPGSGREPLVPVTAEVQRAALDLIARNVLAPEGLQVSAPLQRRLAPDFQDRAEFGVATDYSVPARLLDLQRAVLGYLMSEWIAYRVLDSVGKFDQPAQAFHLRELYSRLAKDVWSELDVVAAATAPSKAGAKRAASLAAANAEAALTPPISLPRRELQREHVNRMALLVIRPSTRVDARGLLREQARTLATRLEAAAKSTKLDADTRDHFADSADTLRRALAAQLPRLGL
jgi:Met-zincin/Domain of unknown function (DUF5117)